MPRKSLETQTTSSFVKRVIRRLSQSNQTHVEQRQTCKSALGHGAVLPEISSSSKRKTNQYEMFTFLTSLSFHFMPSTPSGCASGHDAEFKTRLRSFLWFYLESFTKHKGKNLGKFTISASSTIHTISFKCHITLYKLRM